MEPVNLVVGVLSTWPDSELVRAHRLLSITAANDPQHDDPSLHQEIEQYARELRHRNLI